MPRRLKRPAGPPRKRPAAPRPAEPEPRPTRAGGGPRSTAFVAAPGVLAAITAEIAAEVVRAVAEDRARADVRLSSHLRRRRDLAPPDARFVSQATFALFRWRGWIEPLRLRTIEEQLLFAVLLDDTGIPAPCRVWARTSGRDPDRLFALGDAPNWKALSEGFRRLVGGPRPAIADPWRLFPPWLRTQIPIPPGTEPVAQRLVGFLRALQTRPSLWVRAQGPDAEKVWEELRSLQIRPWIHRRITSAARLEPDVDVYHLPAFQQGRLEIQDLASQCVGQVCDPDPGERWWDACAGAGGKALQLAALMQGRGLVVATDVHETKLKEAVRRARRSPFRNVTTKPWDGKHVPGKAGRFDGVLVDAPCSGIGTWRRNPDARWTLDAAAIGRLADLQLKILDATSAGVREGGRLIYSVCTVTPAETKQVVERFLNDHPGFQLDPFPHPLSGSATDGTVLIWPQEADSDAMYVARLIRTAPPASSAP